MHLDFFAPNTLSSTNAEFDLIFDNDQFTRDNLKDAVIMSLFCWSAVPDDAVKNGLQYGWWAEYFRNPVGSILWAFQREKNTPEIIPRIQQAVEDCLHWIITDGIAAGINVVVQKNTYNPQIIDIYINIVKQDGNIVNYNFNDIWNTALSN